MDVYVIGLTGTVASGKSTVGRLLSHNGAQVIDADELVRELQRPGQPLLRAIAEGFGPQILTAEGELNRARLAEQVFSDATRLARLEALIHPAVQVRFRELVTAAVPGSVIVYEAVKLIESGSATMCSSVWVVAADRQAQLTRLLGDRHMTATAAEQRLAAQPEPAWQMAQADIVIHNSGPLADLAAQTEAAWEATAGRWLAARSESAG